MNQSLARRFRLLFKPLHSSQRYYSNYLNVLRTDLSRMSIYAQLKAAIGSAPQGILDIGCGTGYITHFLGATGLEPNAEALAVARQYFPQDHFENCRLQDLDSSKKYSAVTMVNILEHLEDESRQDLFQRLPQYLAPEGKCYIVYDNMYHPLQLLSGLRHPGMLLTDPTHIYCWPHGKFRRLLERDFEILEFRKGNILSLFLPFTNRFFTAGLYVCVPKKR